MADPVTALTVVAVVGAGAKVGQAYMQNEAAQEKERALNLQAQENILQYQQKQIANLDMMKKTLDRQTAQATVRGINMGQSPSFNAIQRDTLNTGAKMLSNTELEKSLSQENIDIEKENVKNTLYAQLFGDAADIAMSFASLAGKVPTQAA